MLFINPESDEVKGIAEKHYQAVQCLVNKKLGLQKCNNDSCKTCYSKIRKVNGIPEILRDFLSDPLNIEILIKTKELGEIHTDLWNEFLPNFPPLDWNGVLRRKEENLSTDEKLYKQFILPYIGSIKKIFDYDGWFKDALTTADYGAYFLAKKLNRRTCTYCNRQYTNTMVKNNNEKLMRPQFDHWYPKSKFPLLALSFYNLIPSCSICNSSSKGSDVFDTEKYIHPYLDKEQTDGFKFDYEYDKEIKKRKILLKSVGDNGDKMTHTLKALHIDTMYNAHISELNDLIIIRDRYSDKYIQTLKEVFSGLGLTTEEIYRLQFGSEMKVKNFHKRPFSKFKSDILEQLIDRMRNTSC